jgi:hypothetical protein
MNLRLRAVAKEDGLNFAGALCIKQGTFAHKYLSFLNNNLNDIVINLEKNDNIKLTKYKKLIAGFVEIELEAKENIIDYYLKDFVKKDLKNIVRKFFRAKIIQDYEREVIYNLVFKYKKYFVSYTTLNIVKREIKEYLAGFSNNFINEILNEVEKIYKELVEESKKLLKEEHIKANKENYEKARKEFLKRLFKKYPHLKKLAS